MRTQDLIIYGALAYVTYLLVKQVQAQVALPPLPGVTVVDPSTGLPVPETATLATSIPALRGDTMNGLGCNCQQPMRGYY